MRKRFSTLIWSVALVVAVGGGWVLLTAGRALPTAGVPNAEPPAKTRQVTATSTALTTSLASPVAPNTPVTLTATITPSAAAGTVQFKDGSTNMGTPVNVSNGVASQSISTLAVGSHQLTAVFTPANPALYSPSTSPAVPFVVSGATATSTTLTTSAASPIAQNIALTLTATITPPAAAGTVQFKDGSTNIGTPVNVSNGVASQSISTLAVGSHQLTAVFTPANPALYLPSTSPAVPFTISGASATNTTLTTSSATTPIVAGTSVTLTAMINPATAPGTVQFRDGTTNIGAAVAVANGAASQTTTTLAVGSRQLTAVFSPTDTALFSSSTSPAVTLVVSGASATSTALATAPTSPVVENTPVTLTATVTPAAAVGTVQFRDGNTTLGAPVTVTNGTATQNATLGVGSHQLTAAFTATNAALYSPSTSASRTYVVQPRPVLAAAAAVVPGGQDPPGDVGPRPGRGGLPGLGRSASAMVPIVGVSALLMNRRRRWS